MRLLRVRTCDPRLPFESDTTVTRKCALTAKVPPGVTGPAAGSRTGRLDQAEPEVNTADTGTRSIPGKLTEPEQVPDEVELEET
ncbi:hypothetical protein CI238_12801 [Colletotrichum incanum]|uniref:Uncharacterized protein n=1 Tax=Colletotrichum incanum TaxID=1573173 RepID=A0A161VTM6_COLIC|nr:hypothetical protein CI238_12801 [Colletotrichum incanum]